MMSLMHNRNIHGKINSFKQMEILKEGPSQILLNDVVTISHGVSQLEKLVRKSRESNPVYLVSK